MLPRTTSIWQRDSQPNASGRPGAVHLKLTKSAVSKAVARLEARLDSKLLYRTTRRLSLAADGEAFLAACTVATDEMTAFEEAVGAGRTAPSGRVRIDLPGAFGRRYIVPVLIELMGRHPDLTIDMSFTDRRVDLIEDGIDMAVRIGPPPDSPDLMAHTIGRQEFLVCAAPTYLARHGPPMTFADLSGHRLIVGRRNRTRHAWLFRSSDGTAEQKPIAGHFELEDGEAMLAAAVAGLGVAQFPTWLAAEQFASGQLLPIREPEFAGMLPITLFWVSSARLPLRVSAVLEALKSHSVQWDAAKFAH